MWNLIFRILFGGLLLLQISDLARPVSAAEVQHGELPNIIFIWIDTLRSDGLGCYGNSRATSPNIDRLADESYVFMNHHTPHTVTLSSFMSIITGLYPFSHGVLHIAKDTLPTHVKTLAEILKIHGYTTSWFGPLDDPHLDPEVGFGRGFDSLDHFDTGYEVRTSAAKILREIEKKQHSRFFINFHTYHVHSPYIAAKEYRYHFTQKQDLGVIESYSEIDAATAAAIQEAARKRHGQYFNTLDGDIAEELAQADLFTKDLQTTTKSLRKFFGSKNSLYKYEHIASDVYRNSIDADKDTVRKYVRALYDATILEFDQEMIGPLVAKLKELDIYDNTMIIICSDHGEEFGEHGEIGHGHSLYTETTHVPLIIKTAGKQDPQRIIAKSQTVDILPTILDMLGIGIPINVQGNSFAPFLRGKTETGPRNYLYGQMVYHESIADDTWKLHVFKGYHDLPWLTRTMNLSIFGKSELYRISSDPKERIDLHDTNQSISNRLSKTLEQWQKGLTLYQRNQHEFKPNIDTKTVEKIKKTGYW